MEKDSKGPILSWITNQGILAIVVASLTLLLSLLLNELQAKIGWLSLLVSLLLIFTIFIIVMALAFKNVSPVSLQLSDKIIKALAYYIGSDRVGWILTTEELVKFESCLKNSEVWLITSDLYEDCIGGPFQKCVSKNLKKDVKYRYFVPDTPTIRSKSSQIVKANNNHPNLSFIYLEDDFFFLVSKFDFGIINPFKENNRERIGFMGLPVPDDECRYQAKISDELIDIIIGKLLPLIESSR